LPNRPSDVAPDVIGFGFADIDLAHGTAASHNCSGCLSGSISFSSTRSPVSQQRGDRMEIIADRHGCGSILITSQLSVEQR
jgi:hypothetical protein